MSMQTYIRPFRPQGASTQSLAVTTASQPITLTNPVQGNRSVRILNSGSQVVFVEFDATSALASSMPILPNTVETFFLSKDTTTINFIASATGSTVYITPGESA